MTRFWPVMYPESGDNRKLITPATSSTDPNRRLGVRRSSPRLVDGSPASISLSGVRMKPGDTQFTRTDGAHSSAAERVSAITAALAAEYGASP